ncbi:MAG: hypothetical protein QXY64_02120 [Candidatus Bilamarchaeaceae archaeon]
MGCDSILRENNSDSKKMNLSNDSSRVMVIKRRNELIEKIYTNKDALPQKIREEVIKSENEIIEKKEKTKSIVKNVTELIKQNCYEDAEKLLWEGIEENPLNIHLLVNLIKIYGMRGKTAAARVIFDYATTIKEISIVYSTLIIAYIKNDEIEKAYEIFSEARKKNLISPKIYTILSQYEEKNGRRERAISILEMAVEDKKNDKNIDTKLIELYGKEGRIVDATRVFFAGAAYKGDEKIYTTMAEAYIKNNMCEEAIEILERLKKSGMGECTHKGLLKLAYNQKNIKKAEEIFKEMKENGKADIVDHTLMVMLYEKNDKIEEAKKIAEEILAMQKKDEKAYITLINFYGKIKEINQAEKVFEDAKKEFNNPHIYIAMTNIYYNNKEYDKVINFILDAQDDNIKCNDEVVARLLEALRKKKDYQTVIDISDMIIKRKRESKKEWDDTYIKTLLIKGYALKDSGNKEEAIKIFKKVMEKINKNDKYYARCACGLIFCRVRLEKKEAEEIKQNLIGWLGKKGPNCTRDIINALIILRDEYFIELSEKETELIRTLI